MAAATPRSGSPGSLPFVEYVPLNRRRLRLGSAGGAIKGGGERRQTFRGPVAGERQVVGAGNLGQVADGDVDRREQIDVRGRFRQLTRPAMESNNLAHDAPNQLRFRGTTRGEGG